jgi:hypothetical protein
MTARHHMSNSGALAWPGISQAQKSSWSHMVSWRCRIYPSFPHASVLLMPLICRACWHECHQAVPHSCRTASHQDCASVRARWLHRMQRDDHSRHRVPSLDGGEVRWHKSRQSLCMARTVVPDTLNMLAFCIDSGRRMTTIPCGWGTE